MCKTIQVVGDGRGRSMMRAAAILALLAVFHGMPVQHDAASTVPPVEWLALPPQSLAVQPGSALDFSRLTQSGAAGSDGALTLGADGLLRLGAVMASRFNCAMLAEGRNMTWELPTHAESDRLAQQLRLHGYNMARFHFIDGRLAVGTPPGQDVDAEKLDRFQYLLAALKKNGVYWMLDILTSANGPQVKAYDNSHSVNDLKVRVNYDPAARDKWLAMLNEVYGRTNPYTGLSLLNDPALAFVIGANENSLGFWLTRATDGPYSDALRQRFDRWARLRLTAAGGADGIVPGLTANERSGRKPIAPPDNWSMTDPRTPLFQAFVAELEVDTYRWMTRMLNERGYRGPVLGYPEWFAGSDNRTRAALPITDLHAYIGDINSYAIGARFDMPAITSNPGLAQFLLASSSRWRDRPMVFSEYGSPFPNPFRRDNGVAFPVLAGFQGYSTICRMASMAIEPGIPDDKSGLKPIYPYRVALDPVQRVSETLSALLFFRGDVSAAKGAGIAIPFGEKEMARPGSAFVPSTIGRAALLVRFGLIAPDKVATLPKGTQIVTAGVRADSAWKVAVDRMVSVLGGGKAQTSQIVSSLFADGQLPKENRTSVADGVYESQTGEILLDQQRGHIAVSTPRTEVLNSNTPVANVRVGSLSVLSTNLGALVSVSSLDGKPLRSSDRMLVMLVGDARNAGLKLEGSGSRSKLLSWGGFPILLQRVVARITLDRNGAFNGKLSPLALNGRPLAVHAVSSVGRKLSLTINTGAIPNTPTTFFLLERKHR